MRSEEVLRTQIGAYGIGEVVEDQAEIPGVGFDAHWEEMREPFGSGYNRKEGLGCGGLFLGQVG